ncbi:hypothetical protein FRC03_001744 [Tulasnella sp. 419]|nr:hypothetical protein FRC03_001744 [Tulasnella sp. 419]
MSKPSPLRRNSRRVLFHATPLGQTSHSVLGNSSPGQGRGPISNGHTYSVAQLAPGIPENDDEEKQLNAEDPAPPFNDDVGPTGRPARPLREGQDMTADRATRFSASSGNLRNNLDQYPDFWNVYNKEADKEDWDLTNNFAGDLDTLLIFAGLFSATNTAFIVESYKDLKRDSNDLTNNLLRNMMRTMHQSSFSEADLLLDYAGPPARAIVVNFFFFASLCCSLFTAFGAMMGKQWLNYYYYERDDQGSSPSARGLERHKKYMGLTEWKLQVVVETLPTLLQFSLFFFFIGLIDFLWPLSSAVAILIIISAFLTHLFYIITLWIGILYPHSPFQTRLTNVLRKRLIPKKSASNMDQSGKMDILRARCTLWLKERTTFSDATGVVTRAVVLLTDRAKMVINLDYGEILVYFLRPWVYNDRVYLGMSGKGLQSSLIMLQDLISQWDKRTDLVYIEDKGNTYFLRALSKELWSLLLKSATMDGILTSAALAILEKLGPIEQEHSQAIHAEYLVDSLGKPSSRQDQLLRLALLHDAVRSQNHLVVRTYVGNPYMPEVLATTMWGVDKKPDLDHRRVSIRLSWFMGDVDGMYPQVKDLDFGHYLSLWRSSNEQPDPLISLAPPVLAKLYLRTLMGLLLYNQKRWGKELDECGHLTHIETISQDESSPSDTQLLCWMAFILLADVAGQNEDPNAPPSQYYSDVWVDMVILLLNSNGLPWASISREVLHKPIHVTLMMRSLYGYLQTAYKYKRVPKNKIAEAFSSFKDMKNRMELVKRDDAVNAVWARDVDPLIEEISKQEEERERAASEVMVPIPVDAEQEMAPELSYLVDGLESLKNKERRAAASDADKLLALLHNASIEPGFQLLALDFLGYVLMDLPAQEVTRIVTSQSAGHMPHLLQFTMWKVDIDLLDLV